MKQIFLTEKQIKFIKESNSHNDFVDFYESPKFKMSGENLSDYAHVIQEEIDVLIDEYYKSQNITENNINKSEVNDVLKSFNLRKNLNQKIWEDEKLKPIVRLKLLDVADAFIEFLDVDWVKYKDIIITGSIANYNWSDYSDIDLHIIYDFKKIDKRVDFVKNFFDTKKKIWNSEHEDLKIYNFPIEVYVQDLNEEHNSSGVYSIEKNEWIVKPEKDALTSIKLNKKRIVGKVLEFTSKINDLEEQSKQEKDKVKLDKILKKLNSLFERLKKMRKESLKNGSEMSEGNIIFKCLRRIDYIDKLIKLKQKLFNLINTIN